MKYIKLLKTSCLVNWSSSKNDILYKDMFNNIIKSKSYHYIYEDLCYLFNIPHDGFNHYCPKDSFLKIIENVESDIL